MKPDNETDTQTTTQVRHPRTVAIAVLMRLAEHALDESVRLEAARLLLEHH